MLTNQKKFFSLPDNCAYLNGAYMSPLLKTVEAAGIEALKKKSLPHTITSEDFFSQRLLLKKLFSELTEIEDPQNIAIIPSASYGLANVTNNIVLKKHDEILLVDGQFPSNVYSWQRLAEKYHANVKLIQPPENLQGRGQRWNEMILEAITKNTAVVAMAQVHWADGTLFNLQEIRERTNQVGSLLIIDGTQSIGAYPFSVKELQPDALICAGYKWLLGPYSIGVAYYGDQFLNGIPIEDNWLNRLNSENFSTLTHYRDAYQPGAERYSVGESSNFILVPMLIKGIEQLLLWGPKNIQKYCSEISTSAIEKLREKNYFIENDRHRASHLFGIYVPEAKKIEIIKQRLENKNVFVSSRGEAIRVSPNVYNDTADIDRLVSCL